MPERALSILSHAVESLRLHRMRAAFSALGIVCAVVSFVAMLGLSEGARRQTLAQIEQLGMRNIIVRAIPLTEEQGRKARFAGSRGLTAADAERIQRADARVSQVAALRDVRATVVEPAAASAPGVVAVTANLPSLQGMRVASGRFISEDDVERRNMVCVIGYELARRLRADGQAGGTVRVQHSLCKVVGVLTRSGRRTARNAAIAARNFDNAVLLPLGAEAAFAAPAGELSEIIVETRSPDEVIALLPVVRRVLEVEHKRVTDYRLVAPHELLRQAERSRRDFDILAVALATVCLAVGGIGIMNTMLASVVARTREIGIRRAVGATRRDIAMQFMVEAALLSGGGALVGLALGAVGVLTVASIAGWPVALGTATMVVPVAAALVAGMFFGAYPALYAARLDPSAALRHD